MKTEQQIEESFKSDLNKLLEQYGAWLEEDDDGDMWVVTNGVRDNDGNWSEQPCYFTII